MRRFLSIITAEATTLVLCHSALAASDITIAAIATGRLYVLGSTERPHTPVVLDDQFRTESDDNGKFQYELIYHPVRCIVSAKIDGKAYEAVVSNCDEQCQTIPSEKKQLTGAALSPPAKLAPATKPPETPASAEAPKLARPPQADAPLPPAAPAPAASVPDTTSSATKKVRLPDNSARSANPITNPPLPPSTPALRATARAQPPRPTRAPQRLKPNPRQFLDDQEALPQD